MSELSETIQPLPYQVCPQTNDLCKLLPVCDLKDHTGKTYCVEWIKLQQLEAKKEKPNGK